jgi:hypothetical protein
MKKPVHRSEMVNSAETYQFVPTSSTATFAPARLADGADRVAKSDR